MFAVPRTEFEYEVNILMISRLCLEGRKDQPWFSMDLPP